MTPGNLCNSLLHKCLVGPRLREGPHIPKVAGREPLHVGELVAQVPRELVHDLGPPAKLRLPGQDVATDVPIEKDHLAVDGQGCPNTGGTDTLFEGLEQLGVPGCDRRAGHTPAPHCAAGCCTDSRSLPLLFRLSKPLLADLEDVEHLGAGSVRGAQARVGTARRCRHRLVFRPRCR